MKILISGSSGLVGSALVPFLTAKGHVVTRLVRSQNQSGIFWDPSAGRINPKELEGFEVVIHLAGESIASGRWNTLRKQGIRESRVKSTQALAEALTHLAQPPKVFIVASAIGYYGHRGDETLKEDSSAGQDFLADVCQAWETATTPATVKGIRVVNLRFGVILSLAGGALAMMLPPFKLGVGGKIGSGKQYMSWIAIDDVLEIIQHTLTHPLLKGPINVVAPDAVTNEVFTKTLGRVLSRPTLLPMPAFAARLAFGEMADALLLSSQKVEPRALHKSGYAFHYPELEKALRHLLKR